MASVDSTYVRAREGVLFIGDTRVSLSSIIAAWRTEGYTAEELQFAFPAVSLAQIYGAIAYYLDRQAALDAAFAASDETYWKQRARDRRADPAFFQRLRARQAHLKTIQASPAGEPSRRSDGA